MQCASRTVQYLHGRHRTQSPPNSTTRGKLQRGSLVCTQQYVRSQPPKLDDKYLDNNRPPCGKTWPSRPPFLQLLYVQVVLHALGICSQPPQPKKRTNTTQHPRQDERLVCR
ncbi:unnamed protein product [Ectocarpus fasciculatus]